MLAASIPSSSRRRSAAAAICSRLSPALPRLGVRVAGHHGIPVAPADVLADVLVDVPVVEESSTNAMMRRFFKYVPKDKRDSFAVTSWGAVLAFAQAAKATIANDGVNGLTRANFLKDGVTTLTKFDAGGMMGATNIADHVPTDCSMVLQLKNEIYVRVWPSKKGTFDCRPSNLATIDADYVGH